MSCTLTHYDFPDLVHLSLALITGNPSLQNAVEALNRGADAYIMKPLDVEKVLAAVKEQLEKQNEERAIVRAAFLNLVLCETLDSCIRKRM